MQFMKLMAYLAVSTFVVFTLADLLPIVFAFQGTLFQAVLWSLASAASMAVGYSAIRSAISSIFRLESAGRLLELVLGTVVCTAVLLGIHYVKPDLLFLGDWIGAVSAGAVCALVAELLAVLIGEATFGAEMMPKRK